MKTRLLSSLGLVALTVFSGCRVDPAIPVLERELFHKEREIDQLKATVEDLQDTVRSQEARLAREKPSHDSDGGPRQPSGAGDIGAPTPELPGKPTSRPPDSLLNPGGSSPPAVPDVPKELQESTKSISLGDPVASSVPFNPTGQSRRVASIAINGQMTGSLAAEGRGSRGLLVVLEPRDADGRVLDAPAEVNVAVFDPALEGDAARVARWDFSAADTAALFRRVGPHKAMHLTLPWPTDPPKHSRLKLYARYTTADGRRLQASEPIDIGSPQDRTSQWIPARSPRSAYVPEEPASEARRPDRWSSAPMREPLRTASRPTESLPERPVWSPERRY